MPEFSLIVENLIIGIVDGSIYVVVALGLTLLFGVSRIINLAHGEMFAIGGYLSFLTVVKLGINPVFGFVATVIVAFLFGWFLNGVIIAPVRRRPDVEMPLELFLIMTLGLSILLRSSLIAVFTSNYFKTPAILEGRLTVFDGVSISMQRLLIFGISVGIIILLFIFLNYTKLGIALRATSQDRNTARIVGIDVQRLDSLVFGLAAALAAGAGNVVAPIFYVYPQVGEEWVMKGLVAVILGGLGNPVGTLIAGFSLGILESLAVVVLPAQFKTVVGLLIMISVLAFRPAGLMGKRLELEV